MLAQPFQRTTVLFLALLGHFHVTFVAGVTTGNAKQASILQAVAQQLPKGSYTFTNVKTGEDLFYKPTGNNIYPKKGAGSPVTIQNHGNINWIRLSFGRKNKCLSSAWGKTSNVAAVAYACAVGHGAVKSTLEPTKQWFLAVPVQHTTVAKGVSNDLLLAAQEQSVATREKAAKPKPFRLSKKAILETMHLTKRKRKVLGTYYIIPSDHLIDMSARALTSEVVTSRGVKSTAITPWKKGNKAQQWILTEA